MKKYLENSKGSSNKFWYIEQNGKEITIIWGKIGTNGTEKTKEFSSPAEAEKYLIKQKNNKVKSGYLLRPGITPLKKKSQPEQAEERKVSKKKSKKPVKKTTPRELSFGELQAESIKMGKITRALMLKHQDFVEYTLYGSYIEEDEPLDEGCYLIAKTYLKIGYLDRALLFIEKHLELKPKSVKGLELLQHIKLQTGESDDVQSITSGKLDEEQSYEAAKTCAVRGDKKNMLKLLQSAINKTDKKNSKQKGNGYFCYNYYRIKPLRDKIFKKYLKDKAFLKLCCMGHPEALGFIQQMGDEYKYVETLGLLTPVLKNDPDNKNLLFMKGCLLRDLCSDLGEHQENSIHFVSEKETKRYEKEFEKIKTIFGKS